MNKYKILLASQSPRRRELLAGLGYDFETVAIDCDEVFPHDLAVNQIAGYLSKLKADAFKGLKNKEILITADTIVALNNEVLGKPKDEVEARQMLRKLSGKTHEVYTGITIKTQNSEITKTDVAHVEFSDFTDEEISFYTEKFKPFDKAGSYGIQEWIGMAKVKRIHGSFYTIMGLPTQIVYEELQKLS